MNDYTAPRAINAAALIAKKMQQDLARYPKNALSHRDVLVTLPVDERSAEKVDAALTNAIWSAAAKEKRSVTADELINAAKQACSMKVKAVRDGSLKSFLKQAG